MSEARFKYEVDGVRLHDLLAEASFVIGFLGGDETIPLGDNARKEMMEMAVRLRKARDAVLADQKAVQ
jgi:hypothetical protein